MLKTLWDFAVAQGYFLCVNNEWESQLIEDSLSRKPDVREDYILDSVYNPSWFFKCRPYSSAKSTLWRSLLCPLGSLKDMASCPPGSVLCPRARASYITPFTHRNPLCLKRENGGVRAHYVLGPLLLFQGQ